MRKHHCCHLSSCTSVIIVCCRSHGCPSHCCHLRHVHLRTAHSAHVHLQCILGVAQTLLPALRAHSAPRLRTTAPGAKLLLLLRRTRHLVHARQDRLTESPQTRTDHPPHGAAAIWWARVSLLGTNNIGVYHWGLLLRFITGVCY